MPALHIRKLGLSDYQPIWQAMKHYSEKREKIDHDELWLLEHLSVFTQGQAGKAEHILNAGKIPVIQVDRGGQVTYHGPGQMIAYPLIDLSRHQLGVRDLVSLLENIIIEILSDYGLSAVARSDAPGVYISGEKICSIGLRIKRGCSYHGIAFNINMDLSPFKQINPCGFAGMSVTQLSEFIPDVKIVDVQNKFISYFCQKLGYTSDNIKCFNTLNTHEK